ncbi:chemotaxis protein CheW [Bacillus tianshenii]|nr:chemotaxis protein CheW [Bacillus tianshenii]
MDLTQNKFVLFHLGDLTLALNVSEIREIINIQPIDEVPNVNSMIAGVINLRGRIIPVVKLRDRFGLEQKAFDKYTRIIIVRENDETIGIVIDQLLKVIQIHDKHFEKSPNMVVSFDQNCLEGFVRVESQLIGILKLNTVLYPEGV